MNGTMFIQFKPSGAKEAHISYGGEEGRNEVRDRLMGSSEYESRVVSTPDGLIYFHMRSGDAAKRSWPNTWHHDFLEGKLDPTDSFYLIEARGVVVAEYDFRR